jgi:hypothetical protein
MRYVKMFYDTYVDAYQVEIWESLEPPPTSSHSFKVLDQMGLHKPITAVPGFRHALKDLGRLTGVHVSFRETDIDRPFNYRIKADNAGWDNDYFRSHQEPNKPDPNSPDNTIDDRHPTPQPGKLDGNKNVMGMRWIIQRELGGTIVYFHQVIVPPGAVEGTHQHIGSEDVPLCWTQKRSRPCSIKTP